MYKLFEIGYFSVSLAYTECSDWLSHSQSMSTCSVNFDDRCNSVLELGGFASQFATHFYRVANQFSKWFAVCESFYEGMDCIIIHLLLMPATRNKPVSN